MRTSRRAVKSGSLTRNEILIESKILWPCSLYALARSPWSECHREYENVPHENKSAFKLSAAQGTPAERRCFRRFVLGGPRQRWLSAIVGSRICNTGSGRSEGEVLCEDTYDQFTAVPNAELVVEPLDMGVHSMSRDAQRLGDCDLLGAIEDGLGDLKLPLR